MNYNDAIEAEIDHKDVLAELEAHDADVQVFYAEIGKKATYMGQEVLGWLGY